MIYNPPSVRVVECFTVVEEGEGGARIVAQVERPDTEDGRWIDALIRVRELGALSLRQSTPIPDTARASLLAYGTHKPGCGGLTSTTGRACECGWIQVRDLAKAQEVIDG